MRLLLITGEYPPDEGGVADYSRCLAAALAAEGHTVDVLTSRRGGAPAAPEPRGVTVHRVVSGWGWGSLPALGRVVAALRPDWVHLQYQAAAFGLHPAMNTLAWWLRRAGGAPGAGHERVLRTAVTYHDLRVPYLFPKAGRLRRRAALFPARWSHLTIATNTEDYAALATWGRSWRLALVPIGSNVPDAPLPGYDRAAWRAAHGLPPEVSLLAYFGFLNASKGGRALVELLAALEARGRAARLLMLGGRTGASDPTNAAYLAGLEADLAAAGLARSVIWTGHVPAEEVSAWLRAADLAVLPYADGASFRRGSLLACLAHGLPVVSTEPAPVPAAALAGLPPAETPPALVDRVHARLVPAGDRDALAAAVEEVLADPALAAALGAGGRELAGWFGWRRIAAEHRRLYDLSTTGGAPS
jgi:glycosyltransferase involved in cell wall biosynthesis